MDFRTWRFETWLGALLLFLASSARPAAAQLLGPEFQVNSFTTELQGGPVIASGASGHFVVAWNSRGQDGSGWGVFGRTVRIPFFTEGFEAGDACGWTFAVGGGGSCSP